MIILLYKPVDNMLPEPNFIISAYPFRGYPIGFLRFKIYPQIALPLQILSL